MVNAGTVWIVLSRANVRVSTSLVVNKIFVSVYCQKIPAETVDKTHKKKLGFWTKLQKTYHTGWKRGNTCILNDYHILLNHAFFDINALGLISFREKRNFTFANICFANTSKLRLLYIPTFN